MDSSSRRLPFSVSGSRSPYTPRPSFTSTPSSLGSSSQYGRDRLQSSDCFSRASSALKPELDHQTRPIRDYSSADSRTPSWKLPSSLNPASSSYERSWADSPLSSRVKQTDSERRLGSYSGISNTTLDGDSKRAKLSYSSRGAYSRTPSTSLFGSSYSNSRLGNGTGDKQSDSSWSTCRLLSRSSSSSSATTSSSYSSKPLLSRRELDTRPEPSLSALGESRLRGTGLTSSSYQPDRVSSTYAQGARPKESLSSSAYSSTARDRHPSSSSSSSSYLSPSVGRQFSPRTSSCSLRNTEPPSSSTSWYSVARVRTPDASVPPSPPVPAPPVKTAPTDGRSSTRRLLSRLFSRRSSQDSSSSSSSSSGAPSLDSADDGEGAAPATRESSGRGSEAQAQAQAFSLLRRSRPELLPIQETWSGAPHCGPARPSPDPWRGPTTAPTAGNAGSTGGSGGGGGGGSSSSSSWLSSSLRNRCPPLFSRQRREGRDESAPCVVPQGEYSFLQRSLRRRDGSQHKTPEDTDEEEDEDEEEEEEEDEDGGAVGVGVPPGAPRPSMARVRPPQGAFLNAGSAGSAPPRLTVYDNVLVPVDSTNNAESQSETPEKEKPLPSRDPEKLRKIKESLLLEESEEEGDLCRICQMGEKSVSNPLIEPCCCTGSLQYVHQECIKKWLHSKISSGTNLEAITTCELCKEKLHLNIDNFDISELYRTHVQSEYEFISSGLYLVVLLHLCEQRFSDVLGAANEAGFLNLARTLHEHMDNLESSREETDEGAAAMLDNRPSIDFSDLDDDDDFEEY